jgi:peptide/nickel transport system ATP-binding protein
MIDATPPLLQIEDLVRTYTLPRERLLQPAPTVQALQGVSLTLHTGRSLGIVGESGSGKSTLARLVMALDTPTSGRVLMQGHDLHAMNAADLRRARRDFQMGFQDP